MRETAALIPPRGRARAVPLSVCLAVLALVGCGAGTGHHHFGQTCDTGFPAEPNAVSLNPLATECPSSICLLPAPEKTTDTTSLCTITCGSDADCAAGEIRQSLVAASPDKRCASGFVCRTLLPNLESTGLACQPLCVCRDFLSFDSASADMVPPSCR